MKHRNIKIYGEVQGVFFRNSAKAEAERLGIKGFARNEPDGAVYIEAEGEPEALEKFLAWCRRGPGPAKVGLVEVTEGEAKGFKEFAVE